MTRFILILFAALTFAQTASAQYGPRPGPGPIYRPGPGPIYRPGPVCPPPVYRPPVYVPPPVVYRPPVIVRPPVYVPPPVVYRPPVYNPPVYVLPPVYNPPVYNPPVYSVGPCSITTEQVGYEIQYVVLGPRGERIDAASTYQIAYDSALRAQQQGACNGINTQGVNNQPPVNNGFQTCSMRTSSDAYGRATYEVTNRFGQVVLNTADLAAAQNFMRSSSVCLQ